MLSRPPYKSESGLPPGISHGNHPAGAEEENPQRPLNASFSLENSPCCPG